MRYILEKNRFLVVAVSTVILFSIYLRSTIDIGADTGIYLSLGKKIFEGRRYYYDFFESNFPISFYIYAFEYFLSNLLGISVILMSEIFVNLLGVLSIIFSARILRKSYIYQDRLVYNLVVLAFALGFFLRPLALEIGEFGTKTSFALMLLFSYISYSLVENLTNKDLVFKGLLMGLLPCFKPHYLMFILVVEGYFLFKERKISYLFSLDKLLMGFVGLVYLFWMIKYEPEFFEFIVPMWPKNYPAYNDWPLFWQNITKHLSYRVGMIALVFLIFTRIKFDKNDVILSLFFIAASLSLLLENVSTVDQVSLFYAVSTVFCLVSFSRFFSSKKVNFSENKFVCGLLFLIPFSDLDILPEGFFAFDGMVNAWWFIVPIYVFLEVRKCEKPLKYEAFRIIGLVVFLFCLAVFFLIKFGPWVYLMCNVFSISLIAYLLEKKIFVKLYDCYSKFLVFLILFVISFLFFSYVKSIIVVLESDKNKVNPSYISDFYAYYAKTYADGKDDKIAMLTKWNEQAYPISNYLNKDNAARFHILKVDASYSKNGSSLMFEKDDELRNFTLRYLFDDVKDSMKNKDVKVFLIDNGSEIVEKDNFCIINPLEFYLFDPEFRADFFANFEFENRVLISDKKNKVRYDYEVFVRK